VLLAAADRSDPDHTACRELLEAHRGPLVTPELVIAETGWLIDRQLGAAAEATLYESAAASEIPVEPRPQRTGAESPRSPFSAPISTSAAATAA
jgi:predicted nucleic acid-binding protein